MRAQVIIPHQFHSLNEFINADRRRKGNWSAGNAMKQEDQKIIRRYLPDVRFKRPIYIHYRFYEKSKRRDKDNISGYFHKIFQDALVDAGAISDDGWDEISGFSDEFFLDRHWPHIEIDIKEVGNSGAG